MLNGKAIITLISLVLYTLFSSACGAEMKTDGVSQREDSSSSAVSATSSPSTAPTSSSSQSPTPSPSHILTQSASPMPDTTPVPDLFNPGIPTELEGTWEYYLNAGGSGQTIATLELKNDGTFQYTLGLATRAGSGFNEIKLAIGTSCKGKYMVSSDHIITLYDAVGGRCEEKSRIDNIYELMRDLKASMI